MRHIECMSEMGNVYKILVVKFEGKGPLGRLGHTWEDNIKLKIK